MLLLLAIDDYVAQWVSWGGTVLKGVFTLGDSVAMFVQLLLQGFGFNLPLWVPRILTIIGSIIATVLLWQRIGWIVKFVMMILILAVGVALLFGYSFFGGGLLV